MKVMNLYETANEWTRVKIVDLYDYKVYEGLMMGLECGIWYEDSENIFFDRKLQDVLERHVIEFKAIGEDKLKIEVV